MKKYYSIGIFGFLGAVSRYAVKNLDVSRLFQAFPMNTLFINLTGAFIFSLVFTIACETGRLSHNLRLGLTAGYLGAFTTFSTFCKDTVVCLQSGLYTEAIAYVVLSVVLGLALSRAGVFIAKSFVMKIMRKIHDSANQMIAYFSGDK